MNPQPPPVGRFAPSPTGPLHLGHAQTLLLGWLQMRAQGGRFLLRIEDIDGARSRPAFADAILRDCAWLGFDWDEGPDLGGPHGPYAQSERRGHYQRALQTLADRCFTCTCTRKELRAVADADPVSGEWPYPGTCRDGPSHPGQLGSTRVRVDEAWVAWEDGWLGPRSEDPRAVCGDFILWSKQDEPTYQLAVVVDDLAMGVTDVLRGEDLLHSTGRQILLHRWLGAAPPRFAHTPLRRDRDGQRLAKSRGSPGLGELRERGEDPRAILGQLAWELDLQTHPAPASPRDLLPRFAESAPGRRLLSGASGPG